MAFTRRNVWELGKDWADPILWYARGVKAMKARPLKEPTSWRFFGAIHGIEEALWRRLGYLSSKDKLPSKTVVRQYWKQCQHGSWYFLPWHRGYLLAFEAVVRDAVIGLGGPRDWALPYWNYAKPDQDGLPPAFASADWPDGRGDNPLFVKQRYGPHNDGNVFVPPKRINLRALGDPDFTGTAKGGSPGFGGVNTGFSHGGEVHGRLETQPHDAVHVLVGGGTNRKPSLMSDPDTAGLDPIFWLHHANIDRLWEVWRENPPSHADPSNAKWVRGPHSVGERAFIMPMPGGRHLTYTPGQMSNLAKLDYDYDDVSPPEGTPQPLARLQRLGATAAAAETLVRRTAVAGRKTVELLGANKQSLRLTGSEAKDAVVLDSAVQQKLTASLRSAATAAAAPDRVFLNLEHVRGLHNGTAFDVYINVPEGADPAQYPDNLAGTIGLFGVRKATVTDDKHAGTGLTFVIEISHIIDALHLSGALNAGQLHVRLVPVTPVPEAAKISIGHIKVYRQSG
jgi:tyrosinase